MTSQAQPQPPFLRVLPCARIHNFRDYGGYPLAGGGRLRTGVLYRSAQHRDASVEDLAQVAALGLRAVIDLRGASERRLAPCPRPAGFTAQVFYVEDETAGLAPHVQAADIASSPGQAQEAMRTGYAGMPFRPYLSEALRFYFRALADIEGPSLVHCMAGKDRTGIAVALLHAMMGVHRDDILADYMLTNEAGRVEDRIAAGAHWIRKTFGRDLSDDVARVLMGVHPSYLQAALAAIDERHGTLEGYLSQHLGVTPQMRAQIKAHLQA